MRQNILQCTGLPSDKEMSGLKCQQHQGWATRDWKSVAAQNQSTREVGGVGDVFSSNCPTSRLRTLRAREVKALTRVTQQASGKAGLERGSAVS